MMDNQSGPYTDRQLYKRMKKKLKKRIAKLETKLAKYETLTRQLNTTWNTGGWDTVDKVYEAREAVGNLVRHLKEGKKDGV